jgi:hypothetical protein
MNRKFTVDPEWMKACGFANKNNVFDVIHITDYSLDTPSSFFRAMVTVPHPTVRNHTWQVAIGRGTLHDPE